MVWDRFIRSSGKLRSRLDTLAPNTDEVSIYEIDKIVNAKLYSKSLETYRQMIASTMSLKVRRQSWTPQWPVHHRANPSVRSPQIVLDLPNIRSDWCSNLMDWSSKDYLTVAFPRSVYLWFAPKNTTLRFSTINPSSVKWSVDGSQLFIACRNGWYKFIDIEGRSSDSLVDRTRCHHGCYVTSCAFHPTSQQLFILGCSKGAICMNHLNKAIHPIMQLEQFTNGIAALAFNADGSFFAAASVTSQVAVYKTFQCNIPFFSIRMHGPVRALAWHPWERSCLVTADCEGIMYMYNVVQSETPQHRYMSLDDCPILALSFNPHTAELVVSQRHFYDSGYMMESESETQLNVLASFDRVVDRLEGHIGRVFSLNWSPDGTKLATGSTDETARIWNFLPSKVKRNLKKRPCELDYTSSVMEISSRMGKGLR